MQTKFIQQVQHNPIQPISVVRENDDVLVIEGVRFSGNFFRLFSEEQERRRWKAPLVRTVHDAVQFFREELESA
jgi:uncharacterized protein YhbP (UPF0306 family)